MHSHTVPRGKPKGQLHAGPHCHTAPLSVPQLPSSTRGHTHPGCGRRRGCQHSPLVPGVPDGTRAPTRARCSFPTCHVGAQGFALPTSLLRGAAAPHSPRHSELTCNEEKHPDRFLNKAKSFINIGAMSLPPLPGEGEQQLRYLSDHWPRPVCTPRRCC